VSWRPAEAVPEAHLDLEPVRSGWYDVAEVLAGAGGSVDDRDAGGLSRCEVDDQSRAGDPADLLSYLPQIRKRVLPALHDEPIGMPEPRAQRGVVLGDITGEPGDDTHGRFVVPPRSRPGPRVLLAIADDEFEVTSQGRLDQLFVLRPSKSSTAPRQSLAVSG
jgi:hypothetical protein